MSMDLDSSIKKALQLNPEKFYKLRLSYFDVIGQVHSILISEAGTHVLCIWIGKKLGIDSGFCKDVEKRMVRYYENDAIKVRKFITKPNKEIDKACKKIAPSLMEIEIYDEHKNSLFGLKSGSFVLLVNVHFFRSASFKYSLVLHGGRRFNRGIYSLESNYAMDNLVSYKKCINDLVAIELEPRPTLENLALDLFEDCDLQYMDVPKVNGTVLGDNLIAIDLFSNDHNFKYTFLTSAIRSKCEEIHRSNVKTIYCSDVTAQILPILMNHNATLYPLSVGIRHEFDEFSVTLIDSSHCAGSVMYLFEIKDSNKRKNILYTGNFRADEDFYNNIMCRVLENTVIDTIYLDNTYLTYRTNIISRKSCVDKLISYLSNLNDDVYIPCEPIGMERLFETISKCCKKTIVNYDIREKIAQKLGYKLNNGTSENFKIYIVPRDSETLNDETQLDKIVILTPIFRRFIKGSKLFFYSNHSSQYEILNFLQRLQYKEIRPISQGVNRVLLNRLLSLSRNTGTIDVGTNVGTSMLRSSCQDFPIDN